MRDVYRESVGDGASTDLHDASGIAGGHDLNPRLSNLDELSLQQILRQPTLGEPVDTGTTAAAIGSREPLDLQIGNARQKCERRVGDPLSVEQMAGRVIADVGRVGAEARGRPARKPLAYIRHRVGKLRRLIGIHRVIAQPLAVLLERGPTASGVGQ